MKDISEADILATAVRQSLLRHFQKCFFSLEQRDYIHAWYLELIAEYLTACYDGEIKRLNINIPPRFAKSLFCSVAFPMWVLGKHPGKKFICASYSATLSNELNDKCRTIANNQWFREIYPAFSIASSDNSHKTKDTQKEFITTQGGGRYATSTNATVTGKGADFQIWDDLINPDEANSDVQRQKAIEWVKSTMFSRLDDLKQGCIINVQQRLHEKDITGEVTQGWEQLVIPVCFEDRKIYSFRNFEKICEPGDYLNGDRLGKEEVETLRSDMGLYAFSGQFMQLPAPADGGIFKREHLSYYKELPEFDQIVQSWDTAFKKGAMNDYSVCTTWGIKKDQFGKKYYLIDVWKDKQEYPGLKLKFSQLQTKYDPYLILIEDKASGQSLIQDLKSQGNNKLKPIKVDTDKITRAMAPSDMFSSGSVLFPESANWLDTVVDELLLFPNSEHDDVVDSITQFLNWANKPTRSAVAFSF